MRVEHKFEIAKSLYIWYYGQKKGFILHTTGITIELLMLSLCTLLKTSEYMASLAAIPVVFRHPCH